MNTTASKPKRRKRVADVKSPYFPAPPGERSRSTRRSTARAMAGSDIVLHDTLVVRSRFFPDTKPDIGNLLRNPGFVNFYEDFVAAMTGLFHSKPILIQEYVSSNPWKVLIAVSLLNKTAGAKSIPVFFDIMRQWPDASALAQAPFSALFEHLRDLGLGEVRARRLVEISQTFLSDPPRANRLRRSRGKTTILAHSPDSGLVVREIQYPPTPISHIPGCGPYALDSYRIFCTPGHAWKEVRPTDKELVKYLKWRWAMEEYRKWDHLYGPCGFIDLEYVHALTTELSVDPARPRD